MNAEFDHIVLGAGTAGSLLANRLSADPNRRVLVLEGGGMDDWIWFHIPVGYLFSIGNPRSDWMYRTEPDPGLAGRDLAYPRGKTIGGCSAINAMIYMRGQKADYDRWRDLGLEGWGWDDVLPDFLAHEDHARLGAPHHAKGGEWKVDYPRLRWDVLDAFERAMNETGVPSTADFNTGDNAGVGYFQVNQKAGVRWSAARGFLKPALRRSNLKLETGVLIDRLIIENGRAVGVVGWRGGVQREWRAKGEIVCALGAVATPAFLERSGIGDGARIKALGAEVSLDRPGVGANLQDHLQIRPYYRVSGVRTMNSLYGSWANRPWMALEYALFQKGPMSMAPSQMGAFVRSSPDEATPDLEFHAQPLSLDKFGDPLHAFDAITLSVCNLRPESRGSIHARSADPAAPPVIAPNYLSHPKDEEKAVRSLRMVREVVKAPALARFSPVEVKPGPAVETDAQVLDSARQLGTTIFHPVGTAAMGRSDDPRAVVDKDLRLIGLEGLRIADASVMPTITSGNTASPTLMIAERCARLMLAP